MLGKGKREFADVVDAAAGGAPVEEIIKGSHPDQPEIGPFVRLFVLRRVYPVNDAGIVPCGCLVGPVEEGVSPGILPDPESVEGSPVNLSGVRSLRDYF